MADDRLDLSALKHTVGALRAAVGVVSDGPWFNAQPEAVQHTLVAGVIQNFELVYEVSIKMIRRQLANEAAGPSEAAFNDFRDLLRTAGEKGLIGEVERWFDYRKMRNITAHTYDQAKARIVYQASLSFLNDAQALLDALNARSI